MAAVDTITILIAALAAFLVYLTALRYVIANSFARARIVMTSFVVFIVFTLSLAFWPYRYSSLPYAIPALIVGIGLGYFIAVRAAQERLLAEGLEKYLEHAAHVHFTDIRTLRWWSVINFYSVMGALLLINLVGLSTVWFAGHAAWAVATSAVGALLLGTTVPYLFHLWSFRTSRARSR